jgi:hypothetical protein
MNNASTMHGVISHSLVVLIVTDEAMPGLIGRREARVIGGSHNLQKRHRKGLKYRLKPSM